MGRDFRIPVPEDERRNCIAFVLTFACIIVAWAIAHDEYLIRVAPAHFTEYHRRLLPIQNHTLLALQYAAVATFGPGMVFGAICFVICRLGARPKLDLRVPLALFVPEVLLVEACSLGVANLSTARLAANQPLFYPIEWYPEMTRGIVFTQSANITAVIGAFCFSLVFFLVLVAIRRKAVVSHP